MMVLGIALLVIAGLLLVVTVGHDARTGDAPGGAGASLLGLIAAVVVVVLAPPVPESWGSPGCSRSRGSASC